MKRYGELYSKIFDEYNLSLAHQRARRGKTWYDEVKMVDVETGYYLQQIQDMLKNKTYRTSEYTIFTITDGKKE